MSQPVLLTTTTKSVRIDFQFSPANHIYLYRAKKVRPPQRRRCGRKAHDCRRRGHARSSGRRACANRRQRPLGPEHGAPCGKRHVLVDTLGLLLHAIVHPAGIQDRDGGILLLTTLFGMYPFLQTLFANAGYKGQKFHNTLKTILPHLQTQIVKRSDQAKGLSCCPSTLAWLNRCRRLAKDWENLNRVALAFLRLASIRLMLRKLCTPAWCFRTDSNMLSRSGLTGFIEPTKIEHRRRRTRCGTLGLPVRTRVVQSLRRRELQCRQAETTARGSAWFTSRSLARIFCSACLNKLLAQFQTGGILRAEATRGFAKIVAKLSTVRCR
jgi:Transposase DDE domain